MTLSEGECYEHLHQKVNYQKYENSIYYTVYMP